MALKKRFVPKPRADQTTPDELKNFIEIANEYIAAQTEAREASNKVSRIKTLLRNEFKGMLRDKVVTPGDTVRVGDYGYSWTTNESSTIDVKVLSDYCAKNGIKLDKFLEMVSVTKSKVQLFLGEDVAASLEEKKDGSRFDIRIADMPRQADTSQMFAEVIGKEKEAKVPTPAKSAPRRILKVKRNA